MALNNLQIEFADIDDNYREFVNKFKPKKTTDDCYTPDNVFEAVFIRALSSQRTVKKAMFGGGLPHEHSSIESKGSGGEGSGGSLASVQSGESRDRIHGKESRRERRAG